MTGGARTLFPAGVNLFCGPPLGMRRNATGWEGSQVFLRCVCVSLAGALLSAAATPVAGGGTPLEPFQPWVLDYADARCLAFRQYGDAQDPISVAIKPSPNGETFELLVGRTRRGPKYAEESQGSVDFGDGPIKTMVLSYGIADKKSGQIASFHQFTISASDMARGRSAKGVTFQPGGTSFTLESMPQLLEGLAKCNADLQDYWNFGGDKNGRIAVPPKGDVRQIFRSEDYPAQALQDLQEGSSQFLLLVDEHGKVAGCHVEKASGIPIFDVMGCQVILQRMQFAPAVDGKGRPTRSTYTTPPVNWRIDG